jgi:hypothetical protein
LTILFRRSGDNASLAVRRDASVARYAAAAFPGQDAYRSVSAGIIEGPEF